MSNNIQGDFRIGLIIAAFRASDSFTELVLDIEKNGCEFFKDMVTDIYIEEMYTVLSEVMATDQDETDKDMFMLFAQTWFMMRDDTPAQFVRHVRSNFEQYRAELRAAGFNVDGE